MKCLLKFIILTIFCFIVSGCWCKRRDFNEELRIVSLSPSITEIICTIGAEKYLVGRTAYCNYPLEVVTNIPVVGGFGTPSLERLIDVKPTIVLDTDLEDETVGFKIEEMGIKRRRIPSSRLNDIPSAVRLIGEITGCRDKAEELASRIESEIMKMETTLPVEKERPTVYVEIWSNPIMTCGRNSFVSDIVKLAGGLNIGDEIEQAYYKVSSEWVISKNPDVILCLGMGRPGVLKSEILSRTGWKAINAVKNGKVYDDLPVEVMTRPTPRILGIVRELRNRILEKKIVPDERFNILQRN